MCFRLCGRDPLSFTAFASGVLATCASALLGCQSSTTAPNDLLSRNVAAIAPFRPGGGGLDGAAVVGWSQSWDALGGTGTTIDPSIGYDGTNLYAFYVDRMGEVLFSTAPLAGAWSAWTPLHDTAAGPVSAVPWGSALALFYRHTGDNHLHMALHTGGAWRPAVDLGGNLVGDPAGVLVGAPANPPPGFDVAEPYFDVYASQSDGTLGHIVGVALWVWAQESDAWSTWSAVPGLALSRSPAKDLSAVSADGASVDVLYASAGQLLHSHEDSSYAWTSENVATVAPVARLSATARSANEIDVAWSDASGSSYTKTDFVGAWFTDVGLGGDSFHGGAQALGHPAFARPAIAAFGSNIFYVQTAASYQLEFALGNVAESVSWAPVGDGGCTQLGSNDAILSTAPGRVDLVAVGADGGIYHTWYGTDAASAGAELPACSCGSVGQLCCGDAEADGQGCAAQSLCTAQNRCVACGGIDQPTCADGTCEPGLAILNATCVVPANDLNMASVRVTGPVTLQGVVPWTCESSAGNNFVRYPPCPAEFQSGKAPRWVKGQGFSVTDSVPSVVPTLYVPNPSLTLQANVSFTDDTSSAAFALTETVFPGHTCVHESLSGGLEGNHAHYTVKVQRWVDNATNCPGPEASLDPDYGGVAFNAPSPTGLQGCWTDLGSNQTDLYGSSVGAASGTVAGKDGTVMATLPVAVNLPAVSNYLRYVVDVWEGDTRFASSVDGSGWSSVSELTGGPICPGDAFYNSYAFTLVHPVAQSTLSYTAALNPFQVVVQPVALAQLKVLPYTLLYAPPGNASKATYQTTTSFGVSMAFDNKLAGNAAVTVDNKQTSTANVANSGSGLGAVAGGLNIGQAFSESDSFDHSTKTGVGTISDVATSQAGTYQSVMSFSLSNPNLVPGAGEAYAAEPFWSDTFVLLVHPQLGFWELGGTPVVSLLAAAGTPGSPEFFEPTVGDLDACYRQVAPFVNGLPIPSTSDVLTSHECSELLALDPFYGSGQCLASLPANPRMIYAGGTDYGVDPVTEADLNMSINQVVTYQSTSTVQAVGSYTATITDVLSTSDSFGGSIGMFGISSSDTFANTETKTTATDWTVTLQSSYTATAQSSLSITGNFDDHHGASGTGGLGYRPHVEVYRDTLFGSFVFQDPTAPAAH